MSDADQIREGVKNYFNEAAPSYDKQRYSMNRELCAEEMQMRRQEALRFLAQRASSSGRLLDVGCGPGVMFSDCLKLGYEIWGIDLSEKMIAEARRRFPDPRVHLAVEPIERTTLVDSFFDVVIALGVINYLPDDQALFREAHRVLERGGSLLVSFSNKHSFVHWMRKLAASLRLFKKNGDSSKMFWSINRTREHSLRQFSKLLLDSGFKRVKVSYLGSAFIPFNVKLPAWYFKYLQPIAHQIVRLGFGSDCLVMAIKE